MGRSPCSAQVCSGPTASSYLDDDASLRSPFVVDDLEGPLEDALKDHNLLDLLWHGGGNGRHTKAWVTCDRSEGPLEDAPVKQRNLLASLLPKSRKTKPEEKGT